MAKRSRPADGRGAPRASGIDSLSQLARLRHQLALKPADNRPESVPSDPNPGFEGAPTGSEKSAPATSSANTSHAPRTQDTASDALDAADRAALRAALRDVAPLRASNRVPLEAPKPAPVPRRRVPNEAPDSAPATTRRPNGPDEDEALFRAVMADVVPLDRSHERVELETRHRFRPPTAERGTIDPREATPVLPPEADALPPESLFRLATRGVRPIDPRNRVEPEAPRPSPQPRKRSEDEHAALRETMEAPLSLEDRLDIGDEAAFLRPGIPRRVLTDLRRGRWVIQGELDLHGLNRDQAREALAGFLTHCLQQGRRCVRVIHGKGLGSPGRESILKQLSRGWLAQREEILAFCQAAPTQGGSGALMVLLRGPNPARNRR